MWEKTFLIPAESIKKVIFMKKIYFEKLLELLSVEYNCSPSDFLKKENVITESRFDPRARRYSDKKYFFHMVTTGGNAVITADPLLHPFLSEFAENRCGHFLFEFKNIIPLNDELKKHGYMLSDSFHMFLPERRVETEENFEVRWFYDEEIFPFYEMRCFPNAILESFSEKRPDRITVCAYDGERIMGMAGCSEDADGWMQIGIDVFPEYRSMGVGSYLVNILKNKITDRGQVPFYGTSISNYHSWNVAVSCGFYPAWLEIGAVKIK